MRAADAGRDHDWRELMADARTRRRGAGRARPTRCTCSTPPAPPASPRASSATTAGTRWRCCGACATSTTRNPGEVYWAASDVGWVVGHSYIVYGAAACSARRPCCTRASRSAPRTPGAFWRVVAEHGVKALFTAPTAIRAIKKEDPDGTHLGEHDLSALQYLFLAGERLDPDTYRLGVGHARHPGRRPLVADRDGLGDRRQPDGRRTAADQARLARRCRCRATTCGSCARTARGCDPDEEGAICVELPLPPGTLPTLWGDDDRYVSSVSVGVPGYYLTGDGGYFDDDGYLFVMGRTDDVINVAGHRLSTAIDRGGAGRAPGGRRVRGDRRRRRDQGPGAARPRRAQGRRDRPSGSPRNWSQAVRDKIGAVACFKLVDVVAALPKTRSGKILRKTMRGIADGRDEPLPSTIEDPAVLEALSRSSSVRIVQDQTASDDRRQ